MKPLSLSQPQPHPPAQPVPPQPTRRVSKASLAGMPPPVPALTGYPSSIVTGALSADNRQTHLSFNLQLRNELDLLDIELSEAAPPAPPPVPPQAGRHSKRPANKTGR